MARVGRRRVHAQREGDEASSRQLEGEVAQFRLAPADPGLRVVVDHERRRGRPVAVRQQEIGVLRRAPGGDLQANTVLGDPIATFPLEVLDPGLLDEGRPGAHEFLPGLPDLAAATVPVGRGPDRAPVAEKQRRAISAQIVGKLGRGMKVGREASADNLPIIGSLGDRPALVEEARSHDRIPEGPGWIGGDLAPDLDHGPVSQTREEQVIERG